MTIDPNHSSEVGGNESIVRLGRWVGDEIITGSIDNH
jgi:hypothetical protein